MFSFLRTWRARHLGLAWAGYWAGLGAVKLGPAIIKGWRLSQSGGSDQNAINVSFSNTTLNLWMSEGGTEVYSGSASVTEIALWIAVPPLLLLVAWLFRRPGAAAVSGAAARPELGAAPDMVEHGGASQRDRATVREQESGDR